MTGSTQGLAQRAAMLHRSGKLDKAERLYKKIVRAAPGDAVAEFGLGLIRVQRGHPDQAVPHLRSAWKHATRADDKVRAGIYFAQTLVSLGHRPDALATYDELVRIAPHIPEAHLERGRLLAESGELAKAVEAFHQAIALRNDYAVAYSELGAAFQDLGRLQEAEEALRIAARIEPNEAAIHNNLGNVLEASADYNAAERSYRRAIELSPARASSYQNLSKLLKFQGRLDEAAGVMRSGLQADPDYLRGYAFLVNLDPASLEPAQVEIMANALEAGGLGHAEEIELSFALARVYESKEDYARAFKMYERGNRCVRQGIDLDVDRDERWFAEIAEIFDEALLDRLDSRGSKNDAPTFVVGMPRSGSTLVEQILGSHSQVTAGGELPHLQEIIGSLSPPGSESTRRFLEVVREMPPERLEGLSERYLHKTRALSKSTPRFTDKMLSHFIVLGLIHLMFPQARVINTVRDPIDNCLACYRQLFAQHHTFYYTFSLDDLGRYYNAYQRLMSHWRSLIPGQVLDLHYEQLVEHPEETTRALLEHCGLQYEESCLQFYRTKRAIKTASATEVRKPIYRSSVGSWRHYAPYLTPLTEILNGDEKG